MSQNKNYPKDFQSNLSNSKISYFNQIIQLNYTFENMKKKEEEQTFTNIGQGESLILKVDFLILIIQCTRGNTSIRKGERIGNINESVM